MLKFSSFFYCICLSLCLNGQNIINYTTSDGLLTNYIECIDIDINDNLWIGTPVGVQMFDGSSWINYNTSTNPSIAADNIKVVSATSNGDIWIGTDYGVSQFNGIDWTTFTSANGLNNNQIYSIDEDPSGGIWIGTHAGVSYYNGSIWTSYGYPELHWSGVNGTAFDSQGNTWFSSPLGGVTSKVGNNFITYDTAYGLLSQNATSILIDDLDNKWIGTGGGISVLDADNINFTHYTRMYIMPPPDTLNPVVDIELDYYGNPWVGIYVGYLAEGGVASWNPVSSNWLDYDVDDGLIGQNIKDLSIDSENNVWVATTTGISKLLIGLSSSVDMDLKRIKSYPNPSNGEFIISCPELEIESISIYNDLSQLIHYENSLKDEQIELNLRHLDKGIYHLILIIDDYSIYQTLIIK